MNAKIGSSFTLSGEDGEAGFRFTVTGADEITIRDIGQDGDGETWTESREDAREFWTECVDRGFVRI